MTSDATTPPVDEAQEGGRLLRVAARPSSLRAIRAHVRAHADSLGADAAWIADLVLVVDEACQNIIRHGYGCADPGQAPRDGCAIIVETAERADGTRPGRADALIVRLTDFAPPVDAAKIKARDLDDLRPGGLGVHFIRSLTDESAWVAPPPGAGNVLRLVKRLPDPGGAGEGEER